MQKPAPAFKAPAVDGQFKEVSLFDDAGKYVKVLLSPVDEVRDLGVTISADLSWKSQIGSMVAKGRSSAAWVLSVFRSREPDVMMTLYKTYVRSQLEYCSALWHPQCIEDLGVVEGVERAFTSKISGMSHMDYLE